MRIEKLLFNKAQPLLDYCSICIWFSVHVLSGKIRKPFFFIFSSTSSVAFYICFADLSMQLESLTWLKTSTLEIWSNSLVSYSRNVLFKRCMIWEFQHSAAGYLPNFHFLCMVLIYICAWNHLCSLVDVCRNSKTNEVPVFISSSNHHYYPSFLSLAIPFWLICFILNLLI